MKLLRFLAAILSFGVLHTKPSLRFYESPRRIDNCLIVVEEHSRSTAELVVNHSRRFYESPRSIDTLCSVSRRTANPEERKTGEPRIQL
jgi:hypothetical protein